MKYSSIDEVTKKFVRVKTEEELVKHFGKGFRRKCVHGWNDDMEILYGTSSLYKVKEDWGDFKLFFRRKKGIWSLPLDYVVMERPEIPKLSLKRSFDER